MANIQYDIVKDYQLLRLKGETDVFLTVINLGGQRSTLRIPQGLADELALALSGQTTPRTVEGTTVR